MEITVFNIVNTIQQFHSDLADYFYAQKKSIHDTRVQALLDYLVRSERYLENSIDSQRLTLSSKTQKMTINIPVNTYNRSLFSLEDINLPDKLDNYDRALFFAIRADAMLINYCKQIKENAKNQEISMAFNNLCRVTRKEKRNLLTYNNLY